MFDDLVGDPTALAKRQADEHGVTLTHIYTHAIKGYSAVMSPSAAQSIETDPKVASVDTDQEMAPQGWTSYVPPNPQLVSAHLHRIFAADKFSVTCEGKGTPDPKVNKKIGIDCKDDSRVDVDVAVLDVGMDNSADLNVVSRVDCVHPAFPYREPGATYIPPPLFEDPEYDLWHPDAALNEEKESAEYGCLENDGPTPLAAYSFDEESGTTLHDSAGSHDGAIEGATWISEGKYGSALEFDGENDLVSVADAADLDLTGPFTLEAWVRPVSLSAGGPVVAKLENPGGILSGYMLSGNITAYESKSHPGAIVANSGSNAIVTAPNALPTSTWSHLAVTSDGEALRLYLDGELVGEKSAIAAKATSAALAIGMKFNGLIDDVRIYDEALNGAQIQGDRDEALPSS